MQATSEPILKHKTAALIVGAFGDELTQDAAGEPSAAIRSRVEAARQVRLDALVEVHNEDELKRSLDCGADIIGINTRNLKDFSIDMNIFLELAAKVPHDKICVSESGIRSVKDLEFFKNLKVNAVLVGEALMRSEDISAATGEFVYALKRLYPAA